MFEGFTHTQIETKGATDRAPNTNAGDGCAKPQDEEEVLGIELVD